MVMLYYIKQYHTKEVKMKHQFFKGMALSLATAGLCLGMAFAAPTTGIQVKAATNPGEATIQAHIITYCYKIENRALYKRLYNHSTGQFVGDWIFVRYLTDEDLDNWGLL